MSENKIVEFQPKFERVMADFDSRIKQIELKMQNGLMISDEDVSILVEDMKKLSECTGELFIFKED